MDSIFKVGDVVRIRDICELTDKFGKLPFDKNEDMERAKGTLCRIYDICEEQYDVKDFCKIPKGLLDECKYKIKPFDVDSEAEMRISHWIWSSPMLELVARSKDSLDVPTKEMVESAISSYKVESAISSYKVESAISAFKDALEYVTQHLGVPSQLLTGNDEKKEEHKLELKVKNVRKVKLNFKN